MSWNANSIKKKYHEFVNFIQLNEIDIIDLNETKLSPEDNFKVKVLQPSRRPKNRFF